LTHALLIAITILSLIAAPSINAQSTTQTIQGLVTDASGGVVPGATVSITNVATGIEATTTTNETGNFSFQLVQVGNYEVTCKLEGFKTKTVPSVHVATGDQRRADFDLELGEVTETVEVIASAVGLQTENATVGAVVENRRIVELPLNGRNPVNLAVLVPGVQFGRRGGMADGLGGFPIPGSSFSVIANGIRELHQVVSLDGVDAKEPRTHITNFVPSIEALEEFKIQTNAYSAEVGFGGGAVVNMTMKSGTNELHGTLFHFLRNEALDAEDYFLNLERPTGEERSAKDRLRRNQFGAVVSGPIVKNKTFWAFNWEARLDRTQEVGTGWFPLDEFREGDFSELLTGTMNPATGRVFRAPILVYDPFTGEPFPNNVIPSDRFHDGIVNNILPEYMPRARFRQTDPLDFTERRGVDDSIDQHQYYGRVDHHISNFDRIFGRIAIVNSDRRLDAINPAFPNFRTSQATNLASQWIHTFNQNLINEFRFGFNISDYDNKSVHTNDESFDIDALGIGEYRVVFDGNRRLTPLEQGVPILRGRWPRYTDGGGSLDRLDSIQLGNHLSWIKGSHNLKMGYEWHRISIERRAGGTATLNFGGAETGFDFASMLMGIPRQTLTGFGWGPSFPRAARQGVYLHDDWKLSPKLTVNLGLRFDYNGNPIASQGLWRTFDFVGEGEAVGRGRGFVTDDGEVIPTMFPEFVDERGAVKLWKQDVRFFMPRVGIAYRPSEQWVLRLGAGYFDNLMHQNNFTILSLHPPKSGQQVFQQITNRAQILPVTAADGREFMVQTRQFREGSDVITLDDPFLTNVGGRPVSRPARVLHITPDYKDGDVWKWSFDIQRELPWNTALTVGYVGSKGSHVANSMTNWNDSQPSLDTNSQARRPFQRFYDPALPELGIQSLARVRYLDSYGNSFHHGLQAKLDKRYSSGLSFGLAYTFGKSHGDGQAGGNEGTFNNSPRIDRSDGRARYPFDQRHSMVTHYVWQLPGANLPGAWKHVLGNWQSNGVLSLRSGFPMGLWQSPRDLNLTGDSGIARPDRIRHGSLPNPTRKLWFDTQAFSRVTCRIPGREDLCRYGDMGWFPLDSPGQRNLDFSFYKNIPVSERFRLQFRSEFFNAFNTPYFGAPSNLSFTSTDSLVPDGPRDGEIRSLRTPMRVIQFGLKLFF
jgi:hypothetical protein